MHIVILKGDGRVVDVNSYNCQELGLAKALVRKGYKVSLIMGGAKTENMTVYVDNDSFVTVYYRSYIALHPSLAWFENFNGLMNSINPDFVQIHGFTELMSYRAVRWAKRNHVKCNLIQGMYRPTQKPFLKQLEMLFNYTFGTYIIKNVDSVGAKTPKAASYIKKFFNREVALTYIGLDIDKFNKNNTTVDWREKLCLRGKKVLLYIGVLEKRRNPLFLLEIMQHLPDDYVLLIVGDGVQKEIVSYNIQMKNLSHKCIMLGKLNQNEVPDLYKSADLFLLASDYEIYGMVILESMFFGLPVVSSRTAGSEAIIDNGENGVIIDEKDLYVWCRTIQELCMSKDKYNEMSISAKRKIEESLVWDKASEAFIRHYISC